MLVFVLLKPSAPMVLEELFSAATADAAADVDSFSSNINGIKNFVVFFLTPFNFALLLNTNKSVLSPPLAADDDDEFPPVTPLCTFNT